MKKTNFAGTKEMSIEKMQKISGGHAFWGCSTTQGKILGTIDDLSGGAITQVLNICVVNFKQISKFFSPK